MSTPISTPARTRRTQAERSERTREQLLAATIDCLVDLGYAGTSVYEVCKRAGVSRGAQQHHFATKAELMAHALEYLVGRLRAETLDALHGLDDDADRLATGIDLLWQSFSGTLSTAAMELWVAARTDPELRATLLPVDRALGRATYELFREAWPEVSPEKIDSLYWLTVNLTRGLALDLMIGGDPQRPKRLLGEWKQLAAAIVLS
ncbi:MAG TPA: TetR/AcrR family transcriptional regulator [Pseudonocardiaceae bacterium]|nr:TetR/AcrR family transcriptional regulator [Pseudonocardiaceae bacterium]